MHGNRGDHPRECRQGDRTVDFNRRQLLLGIGAGALAAGVFSLVPGIAFAADEKVDLAELLKPGPLGDQALGPADAPNTIVEYASLTCTHCKHFHDTTWKPLKEKYIDTGKVRFILRDFPLNPVDTGAYMLAHAAPNDKFYEMVDLLWNNQDKWAFVDDPVPALFNLVKQVGFTQETFELALKNQALLDAVNAIRDRGSKDYGVNATPTFFINGVRQQGALSLEDIEKLLN